MKIIRLQKAKLKTSMLVRKDPRYSSTTLPSSPQSSSLSPSQFCFLSPLPVDVCLLLCMCECARMWILKCIAVHETCVVVVEYQ